MKTQGESTSEANPNVTTSLSAFAAKQESGASDASDSAAQAAGESDDAQDTDDDSDTDTQDVDDDSSDDSDSDDKRSEAGKDGQQPKPKKKGGYQRKLESRDREIAQLREENERLKNPQAKQSAGDQKDAKNQDPQGKPVKPDPEKYNNYNEYLADKEKYEDAMLDWKINQKDSEKAENQKKADAVADYKKNVDSFYAKVSELSKTQPQLEPLIERIKAELKISPSLDSLIIHSEFGPEVTLELGKDFKELERVNALSPVQQARIIGQIEERIQARKGPAKKEVKRVSSAPAPLEPVGGGRSSVGSKTTIYDKGLSLAKFGAAMESRKK